MPKQCRIGILASGSGSNAQSIMDSCKYGYIPGKVACVISNVSDAFVLQRAKFFDIPAYHINHREFANREQFESAVVEELRFHGVNLVTLAGFMRVVTPVLLDAFPDAVMNIHPALLPSFPGLHAQRQALEHGVKHTGCTVHFVDKGVDSGPIIIQATVPVEDDDTEETLSKRILTKEHVIYPWAIQHFALGKLNLVSTENGRRRVHVSK